MKKLITNAVNFDFSNMLKELCRLCGKENGEKLNVFSDTCAEQGLNLKIKEVIHLNIMEEDPLPKVVCLLCVEHLEEAFYFINHCHRTQIHLMKLSQKELTKYSTDDGNHSETCAYRSNENSTSTSKSLKENSQPIYTEKNEQQLKSSVSNDSSLEARTLNINSNEHSLDQKTAKNHENFTQNFTGVFGASTRKAHETYESESKSFENHIESTSSKSSIDRSELNDASLDKEYASDENKTNGFSRTKTSKTDRRRLKRKCSIDTRIVDDLESITENKTSDILDDFNENGKNNDSDDTFDMSNDCDDSDFEFSSRTRKCPRKLRLSKLNKKTSPTTGTTKGRTSRSMKKENDIRKEKKRLSCATCKMTFTQELTYQEHLNVHTGNRPFSCKLCEASFRKRQELNQHLRTIHSEKQFKCPLCDHIAKHKGKLTEHMKSVHEKPFACDLCNYRTGEKGKIMQHIANKHTGDLSYVCEICGNGFKTKTSLQTHRQNIHFPEPKVCQTCGTVCPSLARYSAHIFRCGKEKKRFPCEKCGKTYVNKEILKDHMNKHLNIRPYKCDVCGKEFYQRNRLDTHKYVHRGAAYRCEICNQSFNRKDNMKNHMKKHFYKSMRYDNMIVTAV